MIFVATELEGAYRVEPETIEDERGFFARTWCREEFRTYGLCDDLVQCNVSFNLLKGTLRGMHYQTPPHEEVKLVRCTMGAVFDVIVDLRPDSPTWQQWTACELTAENRRMLYIPEGFAHGFQTLCDRTEVSYQMSVPYRPEAAAGFRFNDPSVGVLWPYAPSMISQRDQSLPLLETQAKLDAA